jgi:murein L,D-transpeptidase YafK
MTKMKIYKNTLAVLLLVITSHGIKAQSGSYSINFLDYQRSIPKIGELMKRKEDTLSKQFKAMGLVWPAKYLYIRSFKYDSELEIWVKNKSSEKYKLFKTFKICALAGSLGPKRMAGDYQVPEGFYYINEFNPRSNYHLALGLNYPNSSDRMLSDLSKPGGDIYIHGSCVTTGCIPITDAQIEDLYILAAHAKDLGDDFIPVHIFPVNFRNPRSVAYLNRYLQNYGEFAGFEKSLKNAFFYFEKYHQVPMVIVNSKGEYLMEDVPATVIADDSRDVKPAAQKKSTHGTQPIREEDLAKVVDRLPQYPGGNPAFKDFVDKLSRDMIQELAKGQTKAFVMVEYIIDTEGKCVYAAALSGGNEQMNGKIEDAFMQMPLWTPATKSGKPAAIKLKQTVMVGAD